MDDIITSFITWTTYGTWLPGDHRGWRKRQSGHELPKPLLEAWCEKRLKGEAVLLEPHDRLVVQDACQEHFDHRGWHLYAVNARTNHVHVVVAGTAAPKKVRDQLKANSTRALRQQPQPLIVDRTWTRGGDCEILDNDEDIEDAIAFVLEGQ